MRQNKYKNPLQIAYVDVLSTSANKVLYIYFEMHG